MADARRTIYTDSANRHSLNAVVRHERTTKTMKESEIKNAIKVTTHPVGDNLVMVMASIECHATMTYDKNAGSESLMEKHCREEVVEMLMRHIYEDQRQEMWTAIQDLIMVNPMDFQALTAARERLMKAAMRQKPSA